MITLITNGAPTHEYGVKSLVGYLKAHEVPSSAIYMNYCRVFHKRLKEQILDIVKDSEVVGFSLMTKDVSIFMPVIHAIRHRLKIPVVLGGVHPTALPEESLMFSDFVCVGEGEEPLRQLYSAIQGKTSFGKIPNLGYRGKGGEVHMNEATYFIEDMDNLPYPDYQFETSYYYNQIKIVKITPAVRSSCFDNFYFYSQRGCKFACTYCSNSIYARLARSCSKKWYRMASPARVIMELRTHLKNFPLVKILTLNDDDFLARDISELKEITGFLKNELRMPFTVNGVPAFATEEKIKLLADNGLRGAAFGVQTGSSRMLRKIYKRPVTVESVLKVGDIFAKFPEYNLNTDYSFILDDPYEEKDEWLETLNLIRNLRKPRTISLCSLVFFPGTSLTAQAMQDMGDGSAHFHVYDKDYRTDVKYSFKNTLIFLYSYFDVPKGLSAVLLSKFMLHSGWAAPFRFILAYPLGYLIRMNKKVALANRENFFLIKILKKNWIARAIKYTLQYKLWKKTA